MKNAVLLFALLISFRAAAQVPNYVPTAGLIGYWPFTGNANDASGNGHNGIVSNANLAPDRNNNSNAAYLFVNSYINLMGLPINFKNDFSFSYWQKLNSFSNAKVIVDMNQNYVCNGTPAIWQYNDSIRIGNCGTVANAPSLGGGNELKTAWVNYTFTSKNDTVRMYKNGAFLFKSYKLWPATDSAQITLANSGNTASVLYSYPSDIVLDDIGMWNRILDDCEIGNLYNGSIFSITTQPLSQNATVGSTITFSAGANISSVTYQWQYRQNSAGTFTNLTSGGQYSGVTTNILTVSNLLPTNNGQQYRCVIKSSLNCTLNTNAGNIVINGTAVGSAGNMPEVMLYQSQPNPSNGNTVIRYDLGNKKTPSVISIVDVSGKIVKYTAIDGAGKGEVQIDKNELQGGVYFYSLFVAGIKVATKRMMIY